MSYASEYMEEEKGGYYGDGDSFSHRKRSVSFTGDELLAKRIKSSTGIIHPKPAEDDDESLHPHGAPGNQHTGSDQAGVIIADKRTDPIVYQRQPNIQSSIQYSEIAVVLLISALCLFLSSCV
jgi:hypothetical protein